MNSINPINKDYPRNEFFFENQERVNREIVNRIRHNNSQPVIQPMDTLYGQRYDNPLAGLATFRGSSLIGAGLSGGSCGCRSGKSGASLQLGILKSNRQANHEVIRRIRNVMEYSSLAENGKAPTGYKDIKPETINGDAYNALTKDEKDLARTQEVAERVREAQGEREGRLAPLALEMGRENYNNYVIPIARNDGEEDRANDQLDAEPEYQGQPSALEYEDQPIGELAQYPYPRVEEVHPNAQQQLVPYQEQDHGGRPVQALTQLVGGRKRKAKGKGKKKKKGNRKKGNNPWIAFVKQYRKKHPSLSYGEALSGASKVYKR